jgi:hypothetical protein
MEIKFIFKKDVDNLELNVLTVMCGWPIEPDDSDINFISLIELQNKFEKYLREDLGCFYYSTESLGWDSDKKYWVFNQNFVYLDVDKINELVSLKSITINIKQTVEEIIMSRAPYKIWSISALKDELAGRGFEKKDFADETDKYKLVALLNADDDSKANGVKSEDVKEDVKETSDVPVKTEEIGEEEFEEDAGDEFDKMDRGKLKKYIAKNGLDVKVYKKDTDDEIRGKIRACLAKKTTEKPEPKEPTSSPESSEKKDEQKPISAPRVVKLNDELKKKGLWVKGAQFFSSEEKTKLLNAKNEKQRKELYALLGAKVSKLRKLQSQTMIEKAKANKV